MLQLEKQGAPKKKRNWFTGFEENREDFEQKVEFWNQKTAGEKESQSMWSECCNELKSIFIYARAYRKSESTCDVSRCISCELHRQNEKELLQEAVSILMD